MKYFMLLMLINIILMSVTYGNPDPLDKITLNLNLGGLNHLSRDETHTETNNDYFFGTWSRPPAPTPIHGGWGIWQNWQACSKTCGHGRRIRRRQCNNPRPANGGNVCRGDGLDLDHCEIGMCACISDVKTFDLCFCHSEICNIGDTCMHGTTCTPDENAAWIKGTNENCWDGCGKKGGLCITVCGPRGYCCRRGWNDCSMEAQTLAFPSYHSCVIKSDVKCETIDGSQIGLKCRFPFIYEGTRYNGCTSVNAPRLWCATSVDGSDRYVRNMWGYCESSCREHNSTGTTDEYVDVDLGSDEYIDVELRERFKFDD